MASPPPSPPPEPDDSIGCKCGSRLDDKGLMLLCEGCEQWSHAKCYRIRKGAVPDSFYCDSCRPPATSIVFDDVRDVALRARLESDRDSFGFVPSTLRKRKSKASLEVHLTYEERMALEAYWMLYARAEREARGDVETWVGRLFNMSPSQVEHHFILIAEDVLDGMRNSRGAKDGLGGASKLLKETVVAKSAEGDRTVRALPTEADPEAGCAQSGACCARDSQCFCLASQQECDTTAPTGCAACGCDPVLCRNGSMGRGFVAPYCVVPAQGEKEWKYIVTDAVESGGFVCELRGKIADAASAVAKAHWMTPLRLSACEVYVPSLGLCWDLERHSGDGRFVRRSCAPTCEVRTMWVGTQRRLGVWAMGSLQPGTEVTIGWDRPWHTLTCHVTCACGLSSCAVRHWYQERSVLAHSLPVVHERVGTRREDPVRTKKGKLSELETTLNPFPSSPADKPSREERKLQQVLKAFEKLEKKERTQRPSTSGKGSAGDLLGTDTAVDAVPAVVAAVAGPTPVAAPSAPAFLPSGADAPARAASPVVAATQEPLAAVAHSSPDQQERRPSLLLNPTPKKRARTLVLVDTAAPAPVPPAPVAIAPAPASPVRPEAVLQRESHAGDADMDAPEVLPPVHVAGVGGKKAWLHKFQEAASPAVVAEPLDDDPVQDDVVASGGGHIWKKRLLAEDAAAATPASPEPTVDYSLPVHKRHRVMADAAPALPEGE